MFSGLVYAWLAWLLIVVAVAVLRFSGQRQKQRQKAQTSDRPDRVGDAADESGQTRSATAPKGRPRVAVPADYREQPIAAGIIHPAPEPTTADPATEV